MAVQPFGKKYSCFHLTRLASYRLPSRLDKRGARAIVTNAGRDAMDADGAADDER
jgi:hypothetical protein